MIKKCSYKKQWKCNNMIISAGKLNFSLIYILLRPGGGAPKQPIY